jgi:hypothetical protein
LTKPRCASCLRASMIFSTRSGQRGFFERRHERHDRHAAARRAEASNLYLVNFLDRLSPRDPELSMVGGGQHWPGHPRVPETVSLASVLRLSFLSNALSNSPSALRARPSSPAHARPTIPLATHLPLPGSDSVRDDTASTLPEDRINSSKSTQVLLHRICSP